VRLSALALNASPTIESIVERILRLLQPGDGIAGNAPDTLATQVHLVANQHADALSADDAANMVEAISAGSADAPSLTRAAHG
jgi:hypothetical protein